jgi:hypothetical protein
MDRWQLDGSFLRNVIPPVTLLSINFRIYVSPFCVVSSPVVFERVDAICIHYIPVAYFRPRPSFLIIFIR